MFAHERIEYIVHFMHEHTHVYLLIHVYTYAHANTQRVTHTYIHTHTYKGGRQRGHIIITHMVTPGVHNFIKLWTPGYTLPTWWPPVVTCVSMCHYIINDFILSIVSLSCIPSPDLVSTRRSPDHNNFTKNTLYFSHCLWTEILQVKQLGDRKTWLLLQFHKAFKSS